MTATFTRRWQPLVCVMLAAVFWPGLLSADDQVYSIPEIEAKRGSWKIFAEVNTRFAIEGRLKVRTGESIAMQNCTLRFLPLPDKRIPPLGKDVENVKITGFFALDDGQPVFRVEQVLRYRNDQVLFSDRWLKVDKLEADDWMELGDWASERAKFYDDDPALLVKAGEAYLQAIRLKRERATEVTPEALLRWVGEMKTLGIDLRIRQEWTHEALRLAWRKVRNAKDDAPFRSLLVDLTMKLPGVSTPLAAEFPELSAEYLRDPLAVYAAESDKRREILHRLFYIEVRQQMILKDAAKDGQNGGEIAVELDREVPELHEQAEDFRKRALDYRFAHVGDASRDEMSKLSVEFRNRGDDEKSKRTIERWLEARLKTWRRDGADGLLRAAEEYENLLDDRSRASSLYQEAWKLAPQAKDAHAGLERLGYRLHEGRWLTVEDFEGREVTDLEAAVEAGEVRPGMTRDQVRRSRDLPDDVLTVLSAGHVSELWVYGQPDTARFTVHFLRRQDEPEEAARVKAVGAAKSPFSRPKLRPRPPADEDDGE